MNKVVYKYPVPMGGYFELKLPRGANVLHADNQNDKPYVWAVVDLDEQQQESVPLYLAGTGHPLPDDVGAHVNTFIVNGGRFVFHLFLMQKRFGT